MSKHISSKPQRLFHIAILCFCIPVPVVTVFAIIHEWAAIHELSTVGLILFVLSVALVALTSTVSISGYIWKFFDDPILGEYSFDEKGVTFYTPRREIRYTYDECAEIGFTRWVGGSTLYNQKYIYYIYFSRIQLTEEQRNFLFLGRSKKKRGKRNMPLYQLEYVLFQYQPDVFPVFIRCLPASFREKLIYEEKQLQLKPYEKFLHR